MSQKTFRRWNLRRRFTCLASDILRTFLVQLCFLKISQTRKSRGINLPFQLFSTFPLYDGLLYATPLDLRCASASATRLHLFTLQCPLKVFSLSRTRFERLERREAGCRFDTRSSFLSFSLSLLQARPSDPVFHRVAASHAREDRVTH